MNLWLAIFLGGGLGSLARFGLSRLVLAFDLRGAFPIATLASGLCGGFSTFSTFSYENFLLLREQQFGFAIANILVSVIACTAVFYLIARNA
jgi:CrcB protein